MTYISRPSHLETLRGLMTQFHGQTSRYGNKTAAAGDRKLISKLSRVRDATRNVSLEDDQ